MCSINCVDTRIRCGEMRRSRLWHNFLWLWHNYFNFFIIFSQGANKISWLFHTFFKFSKISMTFESNFQDPWFFQVSLTAYKPRVFSIGHLWRLDRYTLHLPTRSLRKRTTTPRKGIEYLPNQKCWMNSWIIKCLYVYISTKMECEIGFKFQVKKSPIFTVLYRSKWNVSITKSS